MKATIGEIKEITKLTSDNEAMLKVLKKINDILERIVVARIDHLDPVAFYNALEAISADSKTALYQARAVIAQAESEG